MTLQVPDQCQRIQLRKQVSHLIDTPPFLSKPLLPENTKAHFQLVPKELTRLSKSNLEFSRFFFGSGWE